MESGERTFSLLLDSAGVCRWVGERERERDRQRQRQRDRETQLQRQRETHTHRHRDREADTETDTDRRTDRLTDRQTDRQGETGIGISGAVLLCRNQEGDISRDVQQSERFPLAGVSRKGAVSYTHLTLPTRR